MTNLLKYSKHRFYPNLFCRRKWNLSAIITSPKIDILHQAHRRNHIQAKSKIRQKNGFGVSIPYSWRKFTYTRTYKFWFKMYSCFKSVKNWCKNRNRIYFHLMMCLSVLWFIYIKCIWDFIISTIIIFKVPEVSIRKKSNALSAWIWFLQ